MRAIFRRACILFLFPVFCVSGYSVNTEVDVSEMLKNAVPRELIPGLYRNERPVTLNSDGNAANIHFNGPGMAHIEIGLTYLKESPRTASMADTYINFSYSGSRVVSRNLGIGEESFHVSNEWKPDRRNPDKVQVTSQTVKVFWEKFILGVQIVHYSRMDGTQDFSHEEAGRIIKKLAEATYEKIHSKPGLKELTVKQRHIDYDTANIRIQARASYTTIGNYDRHEIEFIVRMRGAQTVEKTYDAYAPQVRRSGNDLYLDVEFEHRMTGPYSVKVTLYDTRQESVASDNDMQLALESSLRMDMNISRPKAKILSHQREVYIGRLEPTTVERGMTVNSKGRYIPSSTSTIFDDIAYIQGNIPDATYDSNTPRTGELLNEKTSRFLYEGDKIVLHAKKDYTALSSTRYTARDFDQFIKQLEQEVCFVVLQWENGLKGKALFDPFRPNVNLSGEFIVSTSRGASGKWKRTWGEWFGDTYNFLFDQATGKLKDKAVEWVLEKAEVTLPQMPAMPLVLVLFNLSAGDTIYDDLVYLNLKSKVYLTSYKGQLEVYTLQGSPEIINPQNGTNVKIGQGQMVTVKPGSVTQPQPFQTSTIVEKWIQRRTQENENQIDNIVDNTIKKQWDIPHLQADIEDFYFFEDGKSRVPGEPAKTNNTFDSQSTRYIYWLLKIKYPEKISETNFNISTIWYLPSGKELGRFNSSGIIKPGWTGSYHCSGWGDPDPGVWPPGVYSAKVFLDGHEVAGGTFTISDSKGQMEKNNQKKPVYDFSMWPMEHQLNTALYRVSMNLNRAAGIEKDALENVRRLVTQAKQSYLEFRGPEGVIFNGSVDPSDCPYRMMKVLRECQQNLIQIQGGWERSPYSPQLSQEKINQLSQAIRKAVGDFNLALLTLETVRNWKQFADANGIRFQAPQSFNVYQTSEFPYAVRQLDEKGQLEKVILVRKREKAGSMSDLAFQNELLEKYRKKFADFKSLEEFQRFLGVTGYWATYSYTWKGDLIKVLLYQNPYAVIPVELRYVATSDTYDQEEAEEIIRTLK